MLRTPLIKLSIIVLCFYPLLNDLHAAQQEAPLSLCIPLPFVVVLFFIPLASVLHLS